MVPFYCFLMRGYLWSFSAIQFWVFYLIRTLTNWSILIEQNGEGGGKRLKTQRTFNAEKISESQIGGIAVL